MEKTNIINDINGTGSVYKTNPIRGDVENDGVLLNLTIISKLEGPNVNVTSSIMHPSNHPNASGVYNYSTTDYRFDQVMSYFHCEQFRDWIIGKGMNPSYVGKVYVVTETANAVGSTDPDTRQIWFGDGSDVEGFRNPTKEGAVFAHEYMHIVSNAYCPALNNTSTTHPLAINKAYSDYFGLAYSHKYLGFNSSVICEYLDDPTHYLDYTRDLNNSYTMNVYETNDLEPDSVIDEHDRSVIFSGALWDLRNDNDVSASVIDRIVFESLGAIQGVPSFYSMKDAIIAAAISEGYSNYEDDIRANFNAHGIPFPVTANISGPSSLTFKAQGTFDANPGGGDDSYMYEWRYRLLDPSPGAWSSVVGTTRTYTRSMGMSDFEVQVKVMSSGESVYDTHIVTYDDGSPNILNHEEDLFPLEYSLNQNYPNPFNPSTAICFTMKKTGFVSLIVYDLLGREVSRLANGIRNKGNYEVVFDASALPSGIYYYRMIAGDFIETLKMLLVK